MRRTAGPKHGGSVKYTPTYCDTTELRIDVTDAPINRWLQMTNHERTKLANYARKAKSRGMT